MSDERALLGAGRTAERTVAWSVVGFLVAFYAFPLATRLTITGTEWVGLLATLLATLGAIAIAEGREALIPSMILVYGPLAATLLRVLTPRYSPVPYVEQLTLALVGAVVLGSAAFLVGRVTRLVVAKLR